MALEDAIEDAAAAAYDVVGLADLEAPARHIERAIGARGALIFSFPDPGAPTFVGGSFARVMEEGYREEHYRADPLHASMRRLGPRLILHTAERWLDRAAFRRSFAFRDFYRRAGATELAALWLTDGCYGDRGMLGILFAGGPDLLEHDLTERLEPLVVPLRQAARRARLFEAVQRERDVLEVLLARGASGVDVVRDRHGRTLWMSPRARRLFPADRLPARLDEYLEAFRTLRGGRVPARLRRAVVVGAGVTASVFIVRDVPAGPWTCAALDSAEARTVEALTPTETAVLYRMAIGRTNPAIADELGVSLETVRTHVKRIFRKLEVGNRTEASRRARTLGLLGEDP